MKKLLSVLTALFILTVYSCKSDDSQHPLSGTVWENETEEAVERLHFDSDTKCVWTVTPPDGQQSIIQTLTYTYAGNEVFFMAYNTDIKIFIGNFSGDIMTVKYIAGGELGTFRKRND